MGLRLKDAPPPFLRWKLRHKAFELLIHQRVLFELEFEQKFFDRADTVLSLFAETPL